MITGKQRLEDRLYRATDGDLIFFVTYPPNMDEQTVSKADLLSLRPAPLLDAPPLPPPPPPPPVDTSEEMGVVWQALRIRSGPSATASQIGLLYLNQVVRVDGSITAGDYHFARLLSVNGVKFADVGWVAREGLTPKA